MTQSRGATRTNRASPASAALRENELRKRHVSAMCLVSVVLMLSAGCAPRGGVSPDGGAGEERVPEAWPYALEASAPSAARALVVTDAPLATRVGVDVLRAGGNAVDAAVATAFALAVVYPEAGNIGGGGFMVARMADGSAAALDFREKAPLAATRDMYVDGSGQMTDRSLIGHLASGVPGAVKGLYEAHRRFGTKPWPELLQPAIRLADDGFRVDDDFAGSVRAAADRLRRFEASASLFLPGGEPLRAGTRWRNPDLAVVLRRIAERGPAGFYEGETADLIVGEMRRGQGLITHEDLRRYEAKWRDPLVFEYRGNTVLSMPPASSGGITLALIAGIVEGYPLGRMGWHSTQSLHVLAEAMRRAFADRNYFLGDADFVHVPLDRLLSEEYHASLRATIDEDRATRSNAVKAGGSMPPERPQIDRSQAHAQAQASGAEIEGNHTTHFSIVDAQGNAVAFTTTINELYGSAVTVTGGGFLLNDEMDDFTSKPGTPNMYGLVQGEANAIVPEKRMLSAMTPTIVVGRDRQVLLVTGARGGPRIISAVFQVMSNVIDHGMDVAAAVNAPRIHHQHLPDVLSFERDGLTERQLRELAALGHNLQAFSGYIGTAPTILRQGALWTAVPDPRQGGKADGY